MLFLLVVNRLCYSPSLFLFVWSKICSLAFPAFHSFLPALFSFWAPPLPLFFSPCLIPLVGMRQSWCAVRECSLNYSALAFWSSASFPWPTCFVCLLLFDGAWRDDPLFIPLEGHDGPFMTTHPHPSPPLIVPNIQLPATHIITHQIISPNLLSFGWVSGYIWPFWEELIELKQIVQFIFSVSWTNSSISLMCFIGTHWSFIQWISRNNLGLMRSAWWHWSVLLIWFLLNKFEKENYDRDTFSKDFCLVLKS